MGGHFAAAAPIGGFQNGTEAAKSCQEGQGMQTDKTDGWMDAGLECAV